MANTFKLDYSGTEVNELLNKVEAIELPETDLAELATKKYVDDAIAGISISGGGSIVTGNLPRSTTGVSSVNLGANVKAVIVSCNRGIELDVTDTLDDLTNIPITPIIFPGGREQYLWNKSGSNDDTRWQVASLSTEGVLSIPAKCYSIDYVAFY